MEWGWVLGQRPRQPRNPSPGTLPSNPSPFHLHGLRVAEIDLSACTSVSRVGASRRLPGGWSSGCRGACASAHPAHPHTTIQGYLPSTPMWGLHSGMHVYVHVPFCARRCSYCDFAIAVRREVPSAAYTHAVLDEWALWLEDPVWDESPAIETIYFGGGTPSRVPPDAIARLLDRFTRDRPLAANAEITLEANPDDVTLPVSASWRAAGVNRISLGVQSFDPAVLQWMHRVHTAEQVPSAVEALRCAGFQDLSLDLIFGLPADLARDWETDLNLAFGLEPEHLSFYGLTVEPHTVLGHRAGRGELTPVDEERYAAEFLAAHQAISPAGVRSLRGLQRRTTRAPRPAQLGLLETSTLHWAGALGPQWLRPATPVERQGMGRIRARAAGRRLTPGRPGGAGRIGHPVGGAVLGPPNQGRAARA